MEIPQIWSWDEWNTHCLKTVTFKYPCPLRREEAQPIPHLETGTVERQRKVPTGMISKLVLSEGDIDSTYLDVT